MKVLVTGAGGFLGWHLQARLQALTGHEVVAVDLAEWPALASHLEGVDAVLHLAGINRAEPEEVEQGNVRLATELVDAARAAQVRPAIVYANSTQVGNGTPYAVGKAGAGEVLAAAADEWGTAYTDIVLPNLFGEHGRPQYNSFVATFVDAVVRGEPPTVADREIDLLHVQEAADAFIGALDRVPGAGPQTVRPRGTPTTVKDVLDSFIEFKTLYDTGEIPSLTTDLRVNVFNTLRARLFPEHYPIPLTVHTDQRGRLVETVRSHGGQGQTFVSTTRPGITRGEHWHLTKVERFAVLSGRARISLRKVLTDEFVHFDVTGDEPVVVDMPTLWVHNITNSGDTELVTQFWTHTLFDPQAPDTYWQPVGADPACAAPTD